MENKKNAAAQAAQETAAPAAQAINDEVDFGTSDEDGMNVLASMIAGQPLYGNVLIAKEDFRNGEPDICGFDRAGAESIIMSLRFALQASGCFEETEEAEEGDEE